MPIPRPIHRIRLFRILLIPLLSVCVLPAHAAEPAPAFVATISDRGLPVVSAGGSPLLTADMHAWNAGWVYASPETRLVDGPALSGAVPDLGLTVRAPIDRGKRTMSYDWQVDATRTLSGIIGSCVEFTLRADHPAAAGSPPPELLAGGAGFRWALPGGELRVAFDPPPAKCYFERGNTGVVRAFLIGGSAPAGTVRTRMTLTLPEGGTVGKTLAERYAAPDPAAWNPQTLAWDAWPIDLRFLNENREAGDRGIILRNGEDLAFEDGTPARFWGTNIQAYALFHGSREDVARQAQRIAALGYNLVRIHHHDSAWVDPNIFGPPANLGRGIDDVSAERIDWWIACLKKEGVFVWLDLHVGRPFAEREQIPGYEELVRSIGREGKGFNYVNERIEALMRSFATDYLSRTNRFTGVRYADEPAVAGVLITNENDLTTHFGNMMLPDKNNPVHHRLFRDRVRETARAMRLDGDDAMRTWEPGASKLVMNELERRFFDRSIEHVRALGVRAPIATTSFWGGMGLHGLASLTRGDLIDIHSYGDAEALSTDPSAAANWIHWISCAQVEGFPVGITEWNVPAPIRDRFTAPLWAAAMACFQGWDMPMLYGYLQSPVGQPWSVDPWSTWDDPAITALMPAAAVMYREGHVSGARTRVVLAPSREDLYFRESNPNTMAALRTLPERHGFAVRLPDTPELDFDSPSPSGTEPLITATDPDRDWTPADAGGRVVSDTGEIVRDWTTGVLSIDTARSKAAIGWIGGPGPIVLEGASILCDTPAAAIALTSLDGKPIARSGRILITAVAQAVPSPGNKLPWLAEPVVAQIRIDRSEAAPGLRARAIRPDGGTLAEPPVGGDAASITLRLDGTLATHWIVLEADAGERP